jgi:Concanavalin A-like lectin/glucanases superfamily
VAAPVSHSATKAIQPVAPKARLASRGERVVPRPPTFASMAPNSIRPISPPAKGAADGQAHQPPLLRAKPPANTTVRPRPTAIKHPVVTRLKQSKQVAPVHRPPGAPTTDSVSPQSRLRSLVVVASAPGIDTGNVSSLGAVAVNHDTAFGGNLYAADNTTLFTVNPDTGASVSLVNPGESVSWDCGSADGSSGATSKLVSPTGVTADGLNIYVADSCGVRKVDPATGATHTVTGFGTGTYPAAIAAGGDGYLYVIGGGSTIYQVNPSTGSFALFAYLGSGHTVYGLTSDGSYLYANDYGTVHRIARVALSDGSVSTLATDPMLGFSNLQSAGDFIYTGAAGPGGSVGYLRRYAKSDGSWVNVAGSGSRGQADGTGADAWFNTISDVTSDGTNLYVVDGHLRKVTAAAALPVVQPAVARTAAAVTVGSVTTVSGTAPNFAAVVTAGNIYVDDGSGHSIQQIDLSTGTSSDLVDPSHSYYGGCVWEGATGASAQLNNVSRLATDQHYLYVGDDCGLTRVSLATGGTSRLTARLNGYVTTGVTVGPNGYVYAAANQQIYQVNPSTGSFALFADLGSGHTVYGLTSDGSYLYANDYGTVHRIARVALSDGSVSTLATDPMLGFSNLQSAGDFIYTGAFEPSSQAVSVLRAYRKSDGAAYDVAGMDYYPWGPNHTWNGPPLTGHRDGTAGDASFTKISDVVSDGAKLYVVDQGKLRVVGSGTSISTVVMDDNPDYLFNFDDAGGNGATTADSSGHQYDGVYTSSGNVPGSPGVDSDPGDYSALMLADSGGGVVAPGAGLAVGNSPRTVEAWIRTARTSEDVLGWGGTRTAPEFVVAVRGKTIAAITPGGEVSLTAPYTLNDSSWHYVALTYANGLIAGYVDGTSIGTSSISTPLTTPASDLRIGDMSVDGDSPYGGYIDRVGVFARALSAGDIRAHYLSVSSTPDYQLSSDGVSDLKPTGNAYADAFLALWFATWNEAHATAVFATAESASAEYGDFTSIAADLWALRGDLDATGLTVPALVLNSGALRPDLVLTRPSGKVVYEVKSVGQASRCPAQVASYAAAIPATLGVDLPTSTAITPRRSLALTVYSGGDPGCVLYTINGGPQTVYQLVYTALADLRLAEAQPGRVEERVTSAGWQIFVDGVATFIYARTSIPTYIPIP